MRTYEITLIGKTPLLMHYDNIEWADFMEAWKTNPENKKGSKAGDDRSPAWRWIGSCYHDGDHLCIPQANIMRALMEGGAMVPVPGGKMGKTFKSQTQSGMMSALPYWDFYVNGERINWADIEALKDVRDFSEHRRRAQELGFDLFRPVREAGQDRPVEAHPRAADFCGSRLASAREARRVGRADHDHGARADHRVRRAVQGPWRLAPWRQDPRPLWHLRGRHRAGAAITDDRSPQHLPWADGMPTRPDVDALLAAFPPATLLPGVKLTDDQLLLVIGKCTRTRFRTVYAAWTRRLQADHRIVMKREREAGFFVPTAAQVLSDTHPTLQHIGRSAKKQIQRLAVIKPENHIEADTRDHHGRLLGVIRREAKRARANLLPDTTVTAAPQITPPIGAQSQPRSEQ